MRFGDTLPFVRIQTEAENYDETIVRSRDGG